MTKKSPFTLFKFSLCALFSPSPAANCKNPQISSQKDLEMSTRWKQRTNFIKIKLLRVLKIAPWNKDATGWQQSAISHQKENPQLTSTLFLDTKQPQDVRKAPFVSTKHHKSLQHDSFTQRCHKLHTKHYFCLNKSPHFTSTWFVSVFFSSPQIMANARYFKSDFLAFYFEYIFKTLMFRLSLWGCPACTYECG